MSENFSSNPQFVGQADGTKSGETFPKDELALNAEQQQVVDVMQAEGQKLETAVLDAREKAAGQLKQLHGKELVDAGLKQMGHGVWETFKSRMKWMIGGGLAGMIGGGLAGATAGKSYFKDVAPNARVNFNLDLGPLGSMTLENMTKEDAPLRIGMTAGGAVGAYVGDIIGIETAGRGYNRKIAAKQNLPPTKWYDWVASNAGLLGLSLLLQGSDMGKAGVMGRIILKSVLNPISVGGMRNVATGLWQMRKG